MNLIRRPSVRVLRNSTFGLVIAGSMLLAACGGEDPTPTRTVRSAPAATVQVATPVVQEAQPTTIDIDMHDFAFDIPTSIPAGWVDFRVTNSGQEPHHGSIVKLNEGVTVEQFNAAMQENPDSAFGLMEMAGGIPDTEPGGRQRATLKLSEGTYLAVCFIAGEDGVPHIAKGMQQAFQVTAATAEVADPLADVTVDMHDFAFTMPDEVLEGHFSMKVVNSGSQPHEVIIFKLNEGATVEELLAFAAEAAESDGPPATDGGPGEMVGAAYPVAGGGAEVIYLHLETGNYVAVCFIPDPASGKSHLELGMVKEFTVKAR